MAVTVHVHHSCGHSAQVVSPGPLDPEGLIAANAPRGMATLGLAARPCSDCARVAGPIEPLEAKGRHGSESYAEMQARVEGELQTNAKPGGEPSIDEAKAEPESED